MAAADYYLCDVCGCKTFYDSAVDYGDRVGDMAVVCPECAKTHKIHILAAHSEQGWVSVTLDSLPPVDEQITLVCMRDIFPKAETMSLNHQNLHFIAQALRANSSEVWTHWKHVGSLPAPPVHPESAQEEENL